MEDGIESRGNGNRNRLSNPSFEIKQAATSLLVVDDEEMMRELVSERLRIEGYKVEEAQNGMEAFDKLQCSDYHLLLTDINMPVMNGLQLLKRLDEKEDLATVVMSGQGDLETAVYAMKLGASDFITKPVNFRILIHTIEAALKNKMMEQALKDYQQNLEDKIYEQTKIINEFYLRSVHSLVKALEAKDEYTKGHSERVTHYSLEIGKMIPDDIDLEKMRVAGILHDLGKIGVPETVLNKPGKLSDKEFEMVRKHPELGVEILEPIEFLRDVFPIILHHHEKYDGTGYPCGLKGKVIPIESRVLAIADTFDAMTSTRAYRKALTIEEAKVEIKRCSGTQFDPEFASIFLNIHQELSIPENVWVPDGIMDKPKNGISDRGFQGS
jgi:putative nucleotidyltransferase with HDIG domain